MVHPHIHRLIGGFGDDIEEEESLASAPASAPKYKAQSTPLPKEFMDFTLEEVEPPWPPVEGWPFPHRGGYSPSSAAPWEKGMKKKKGGSASKEKIIGEAIALGSIGEPLPAPTSDSHSSEEELDDTYAEASHTKATFDGTVSDFVLRYGQGLYFEGFMKAIQCSPGVAMECIPLLLRSATDFGC
jgi:hypothetical protein